MYLFKLFLLERVPLRGLHKNQQKILEHLLDHPKGATLLDLAEHLGVTKTAAKEHINRLIDMGYVDFEDSRGGIGRPLRRYLLSDQGIESFPRRYSWLSNAILTQLTKDLPPSQVARFMESLADSVTESMEADYRAKDFVTRLTSLTRLMSDLGYRAVLKEHEAGVGATIEAVNCVYHEVAKKNPQLCGFDIRLIKNLSQMDVNLETCIAKGGHVCRFCLQPPVSK